MSCVGLREDTAGYDADYWRRGAELGWTSLLVSEEHGGGQHSAATASSTCASSRTSSALTRRPDPLIATSLVGGEPERLCAPKARRDAGGHSDVLAGLLDGSVVATWCLDEPAPASARHRPRDPRRRRRRRRQRRQASGRGCWSSGATFS